MMGRLISDGQDVPIFFQSTLKRLANNRIIKNIDLGRQKLRKLFDKGTSTNYVTLGRGEGSAICYEPF
jgi:hypothetical protein